MMPAAKAPSDIGIMRSHGWKDEYDEEMYKALMMPNHNSRVHVMRICTPWVFCEGKTSVEDPT